MPPYTTADIPICLREHFQRSSPWVALLQVPPQQCTARPCNPATGSVDVPATPAFASNYAPRTGTAPYCREQRSRELNYTQPCQHLSITCRAKSEGRSAQGTDNLRM